MKKFLTAFFAILLIFTFAIPSFAADAEVKIDDYPTTEYTEASAKVATMELMYSSEEYGYDLYFDRKSAEFALLNKKTGEYLFSNPYDIAVNNSTTLTETQQGMLLSQVILTYTDLESKTTSIMSSYTYSAAYGDQIKFKNMSNGVRVEYAIGTVESKRLIPIWIEKTRFETMIYDVLKERKNSMTEDELFVFNHLYDTYYKLIDQTNPQNESSVSSWRNSYPCLANDENMIIYVFQQSSNNRALKNVESLIRKYCPSYSYDELEYDHELTGYEGDEKEPPLFRLAIEYTIDKDGLNASIPSKSIRYNETNYTLQSVRLLPFAGCSETKTSGTKTTTGGYIFIPDGSGTLLNYYLSDGAINTGNQGSLVYGVDYAYQTISNTNPNAQSFRLPVFGLTEYYNTTITTNRTGRPAKIDTVSHERGFLGIITEGESFANIIAYMQNVVGDGGVCDYNTVCTSFSTVQTDTVTLGNSLASDSALTTTVDTKYLGNYTVKYIMLSDNEASNYEASYVGMAAAYRQFLVESTNIKNVTDKDSMPLYIQSFGSAMFNDKFLTLPIRSEKAMTTFDDVINMSETFRENGISNLNFILSAFANGNDILENYPTYVKWRGKVGGANGFRKLLQYAKEKNVSIYPNFDFANAYKSGTFTGFSWEKYCAKSMSGLFITKRNYDAVMQFVMTMGKGNIISASSYDDIYKKFYKDYSKYDVGSIASLTLGTDLNSDFDDEGPLTRQDSEEYTTEFLRTLSSDYDNVLVSGGNSYVLPHVTDVVDVAIDNSGFTISSAAVPFTGMVFHGLFNYAGSALNMEGDVMYYMLKSLENGASLYFILACNNTEKMKDEFDLSVYYSVSFETWKDDVIKYYKMLNAAIGDMQNAKITNHQFIEAYRATDDEGAALLELNKYYGSLVTSTKKTFFDAIAYTDKLIADSRDTKDAVIAETNAQNDYNKAVSFNNMSKSFTERYKAGQVVKVEYKTENKTKTFYINFNSYDVVMELNGKIYRLPSLSFTEEKDLKASESSAQAPVAATAFTGANSAMENFKTTYENLKKAIENNNTSLIRRYTEALEAIKGNLTAVDGVICVKGDRSGASDYYINLTESSIIFQVGENSYYELAGESYIAITPEG